MSMPIKGTRLARVYVIGRTIVDSNPGDAYSDAKSALKENRDVKVRM